VTKILRIGAAQVDITPKAGVQLVGNIGVHRPAEVVSDLLFSKALVLECNGRKACFITLDVCIATKRYCDEIRRTVVEKFEFDFEEVMIHALQIHSAPSLGHFMLAEDFEGIPRDFDWLRGGNERYNQFAVELILESIRLANETLEPV